MGNHCCASALAPAAEHGREVHSHKGQKRAIIEQFGAKLIAEDQRAGQADGADENARCCAECDF